MAKRMNVLRALDNAKFFSQMCFFFKQDEKFQEKMLKILEKDKESAKKEIEKELETTLVLLLGENHPNYWKHFSKMYNKNFEISCRNLFDYGNYLARTFDSFEIKQAGISDISLRKDSYEDFEKKEEIPTMPEFLYSMHFGYKFRNNPEIISKIKTLLETNEKSADFFLSYDKKNAEKFIRDNSIIIGRKAQKEIEKARDYLSFLEN